MLGLFQDNHVLQGKLRPRNLARLPCLVNLDRLRPLFKSFVLLVVVRAPPLSCPPGSDVDEALEKGLRNSLWLTKSGMELLSLAAAVSGSAGGFINRFGTVSESTVNSFTLSA